MTAGLAFALIIGQATIATGPPVAISAVAFRPGAPILVAGGYQEILVWDLQNAKLERRLGAGKIGGQVRALAFSKDGKTLAVAEGEPAVRGAVHLVDFATGEIAATLVQSKDEIGALAFSGDGKLLAAGGADAIVRVWSLADRKVVKELKAHSDWVTGLSFSPKGNLMASASADRTVQVWDTATWAPVVSLPQNPLEPVRGVAFSPDGATLAFAAGGPEQMAVHTWQPDLLQQQAKAGAQRQINTRFTRPLDTGTCLAQGLVWALSGRPRIFLPCTDKTVRVLGATGGTIAVLSGHQDWVYGIAASADGTRVASGGGDGTVRIWNAADGAPLATLLQLRPRTDEWVIVGRSGVFATSNRAAVAVQNAETLENPQAVRDALAGKPEGKKK